MFIAIERLCDNGLSTEVRMLDRHYPRSAWDRLSLTELAAAKFMCDGLTGDELAERLDLPSDTVHAVVSGIFDKLGVLSRVELVVQAIGRHGVA